ncbi:MAG TPA: topoisomerase C-terminal repeat-containing protein, partial [Casimicrobiaceae bacterium]|nr:topoisomerase C-terminal repeat-containing protein [Casimicrobiaceae bacterium]
ILQRPIERAQMTKLLETGKTDLLQFVSARTRRPFSAFFVKQADGKVGFEFEAREPGRKGARPARAAALRTLGAHPRDGAPVELHAGRYGPYVKHGATNATLPDKDAVDALTLDEAVALVDAKAGREGSAAKRSAVKPRAPRKAPAATKTTAARKPAAAKTSAADSRVKAATAAATTGAKRVTRAKAAASAATDAAGAGAKAATPATTKRKPAARSGTRTTRR